MANTNLTGTGSAVVLDQRMWSGSDNASTAWLQSPIGSNAAAGAMHLMVVDVVVTAASTATVVDLADADSDEGTPVAITGLGNGGTVLEVLSVSNRSGGNEMPTLVRASGSTVAFTTASGTAGDTHRVTLLYYA